MTKRFDVTGMSCAACSARVEKAVSGVEGVDSCAVNLLTNSMIVEGSADDSAIVTAVKNAGYGASPVGAKKADNTPSQDTGVRGLVARLVSSAVFLAFLMYFSMGHMMWGWPLPPFFEGNHVAVGLVQMLLCIIVMVINQKFFISGFRSVIHGAPNMDTLVAMGSGVSFLWSVWVLFDMTGAAAAGDADLVMKDMMNLYFESAAMILTLITVGKTLEAVSKGRTTDALKSLMKLSPRTAVIEKNGEEITVPIEELAVGDIFLVRPGDSIPADGVVVEGHSAVNEAALTGESVPADKEPGDRVSAATVNQSGFIRCRATGVGEDTALSRIIKMVSDASATKAPIAKLADKVSGIFVPSVIAVALVTFIVWLAVGQSTGYALARGISVLVISCPCALGLATPVAIMVGSGVGAKNGILFKTAVSLEQTGKCEVAVLDKTGTVTRGEPVVTDVISSDPDRLISAAYSVERFSEHPLAKAVCLYARDHGAQSREVTDFTALPGSGVSAKLDGKTLTGASARFAATLCNINAKLKNKSDELSKQGKTPLFFVLDGECLGLIAVADVIREDSAEAVKQFKNMGVSVLMLTGDNRSTAEAVGAQAGVDGVIAGVLPEGKEKVIRALREKGRVAMIGDGINDAPALTSADVGIAVGAGTDVAIDAADVVLSKSRLTDAAAAFRLSRATLRNVKENLFWAFIYNVIGIPLAAGVFIPIFGWELQPMFGAAAMSLSSFCVVSNALRLNLVRPFDSSRDKKRKNTVDISDVIKEEETVDTKKTVIKIEGMMCPHCEATVKGCLEAFPNVQSAAVSHEKGTAEVSYTGEADLDAMKKAIEDKGYKVVG